MKANELRIGNYVHHIGLETSIILELRNDGISVHSPSNKRQAVFEPNDSVYRLEPIPLTQDWLLKFGFEEGQYTEYTFDTYILNGVSLWNKNKDFSLLVFEGFNQLQIKYVHQLQNLYFALTQKELTIKETIT